jgi:hypothetical protein
MVCALATGNDVFRVATPAVVVPDPISVGPSKNVTLVPSGIETREVMVAVSFRG